MISLKNKKKISALILLMNIVTFFTTFYILIYPAESQTAQNYIVCGYEEHIHTDECYIPYGSDYTGDILICEIAYENGGISHIHDAFCYDSSDNLICPLEEYVHTHEQSCFNENNEQICGTIVHQHTEQCFCSSESLQNKEDYKLLVCSKNVHIHRDSCFEKHTSEMNIQSEEFPEENPNISLMYNENNDIEILSEENNTQTYSFDTTNAIDMSEKSDGAYKYIKSISVSYQSGDSWIQIEDNEDSSVKFPANADYRLEVSYKNISISELSAHNGKIMLTDIPVWLNPDKDGEILLNSEPVASMQVQNGVLLIKFYESFMQKYMQENDTNYSLNGNFFVRGSVNWQKLNNDTGEIHLPTIDMTINFENNLPQKYGQMSILKSDPELVYNNDKKPYFKYTVTVKSAESECIIPNVSVKDSFTENKQFIKNYCGITAEVKPLGTSENGFEPYETRSDNSTAGTVAIDAESQDMCWNIGNLQPREERTLTYYTELDEYYTGSYGRGRIINTAEAFSGDIPKGSNSGEFTPRAEAWIDKEYVSAEVNDYGTGTAVYRINIHAGRYNSYDLINLRLHDYFDSRFKNFVEYPVKVTAKRGDGTSSEIPTEKPDETSFNATIPVLEPGETITVEYTVNLKNILASGTGNIDFLNTAELFSENNSDRGDASNHHFGSSQNWHTFWQSQWVRKLDGGNVKQDTVIQANTGTAYQFSGSGISSASLPQSFTVPNGSKKYQVVLNEKGTWDLSSAAMKDKFNDNGIIYKGWLCIQEFEKSGVTGLPTDSEVISTLSKKTPSQTVWLNIDGISEFSFTPSQLGLSKNYTYLMTYYAGIEDVAHAGELMITNDFEVYGDIGAGGTYFKIGGIKVGVSSIMQGNIHYNVHKDAWYYSENPTEDGKVPINNVNKDYPNGALYWVIKLDGTINAEFRVKDIINGNKGTSHHVCLDTLAGIYKGSKSLKFTDTFHSYSEMLGHVGNGKELEQISGNPYNFGYYYGWNNDYGHYYDSENIGMIYDKTDINNISELNGRKFVIANVNAYDYYYGWQYAVVTNEPNNNGLRGEKNIRYLNQTYEGVEKDKAIASSNMLTEWTFEQVSGNKYHIYSYIDNVKKYMQINNENDNGKSSVSLSDSPVELTINLGNGDFSGRIMITNGNGTYLNWYGANGINQQFAGWYAGDSPGVNDHCTLFETKCDYKWCAVSGGDIGICFQRDMNLADDEALYIVVRTVPSHKPSGEEPNDLYENGVASKQSSSSSDWVNANTTDYILKTAPAVYKEGKASYTFDGTELKFSAGEEYTDGHERISLLEKDLITESGTYAEWLVNVNWDGSMEGLAEVSDQLPENVIPVYLRQYYTTINPAYPTIPELENDKNWTKKDTSGIPFYYNPATNEIRWRVGNLEKETDPYLINKKTVNLQLVCKINDPDILLSGATKSVDNTVTVKNNGIVSKSTDSVDVSPKCSLKKAYKGNLRDNNNGKQYSSDKQLPFEITVNENKETLSNNGFLPPLIDEFSSNLVIIESSLEIKSEDGTAITGYTYKIDNNKLIINKLPDGKKIIITYNARTDGNVDKEHDIIVSNSAYWSGHEPTDNPQVDSLVINYSMGGDAELNHNPTVSILKVDSENSAKRLQGAEFALYEQNGTAPVASGTTDKNGRLKFESNSTYTLHYDTVYYITETKAPDGYSRSNENYYFVILKSTQKSEYSNIGNIDIWDSAILDYKYERTIRNDKAKISVNKTFADEITGNSVPDSAKFSFGIFDKNPENNKSIKPLQILEIEYINGTPQYKLDNIPKNAPEFTVAEPNQAYYVFELDESLNPVFNGEYLNLNGKTYEVQYDSQLSNNNMVTIAKNQINIENKTVYFIMPESGGTGLKKYYLFAGLFSVISLTAFVTISGFYRKL